MSVLQADGSPNVRVAILTPCQDAVSAGFAFDLARLTGQATAGGIDYTVLFNRGTIIPQQRATLVRLAQEWGATHVLWLDSDMRFPSDTLSRLLAHSELIVAANYSTRRHPILPTAEHKQLGHLFTTVGDDGLVEVSHVGMGCMLVDMSVYARIKEPWFILGFNPGNKEYIGEDVFFLRRAKEYGFVPLIDQALSHEVRHVGEMEWRAEHALVTRDTLNRAASGT